MPLTLVRLALPLAGEPFPYAGLPFPPDGQRFTVVASLLALMGERLPFAAAISRCSSVRSRPPSRRPAIACSR
jgi:hypothetical protein